LFPSVSKVDNDVSTTDSMWMNTSSTSSDL